MLDLCEHFCMCRKDSFITHRAFCDALAEESARISASQLAIANSTTNHITPQISLFPFPNHPHFTNPPPLPFTTLTPWDPPQNPNPNTTHNPLHHHIKPEETHHHFPLNPPLFQDTHKGLITSPFQNLHVGTQPSTNVATSAHLSATALLQKAATIGASAAGQQQTQSAGLAEFGTAEYLGGFTSGDIATWQKTDRLTRDFLGLTSADGNGCDHGNGAVNVVKDMLTYAGGVEYQPYHDQRLRGHHALLKPQGFGFAETTTASETWGDC